MKNWEKYSDHLETGDFHVHTNYTEGSNTVDEMCQQALKNNLTLICFACLIIVGVPVYEAMVLSFSALSTGGIVPATDSLDLLLGNAVTAKRRKLAGSTSDSSVKTREANKV